MVRLKSYSQCAAATLHAGCSRDPMHDPGKDGEGSPAKVFAASPLSAPSLRRVSAVSGMANPCQCY